MQKISSYLLFIFFAQLLRCQVPTDRKGTIIVFMKVQDPSVGLRVYASADRMYTRSDPNLKPLEYFYNELADKGKITRDQAFRYKNMLINDYDMANRDPHYQKIQYIEKEGPGASFAVGIHGHEQIVMNFAGADKTNVNSMEDVASLLDRAYKKLSADNNIAIPEESHYSTDGRDIYELVVGRYNKPPKIKKLKGNLYTSGWGQQEMHDRLKEQYDRDEPGSWSRTMVLTDLNRAFQAHSKLGVDPRSPKRPHNPVSASWAGAVLGPDVSGFDEIGRHNQDEYQRVRNMRKFKEEEIVEDLVREGAWNPDKIKHHQHKDPYGTIYKNVMDRLIASGWTPPPSPGGEESTSRADYSRFRKFHDSYTGRNERIPPTPRKGDKNRIGRKGNSLKRLSSAIHSAVPPTNKRGVKRRNKFGKRSGRKFG